MNLFVEPKLNKDFAHYVVRLSIIKALKRYLPQFSGIVVDLGCGNMPYKEIILSNKAITKYISVDWPETDMYKSQPDVVWDGKHIPLEDNSIDFLLLTEVAEHLSDPESVFREIKRILKPGGVLVGTTPFFWPLHEVPHDIQRLSPFGIKRIIDNVGFSSSEIIAAGGWKTSFAQFLCAYGGIGIKNRYLAMLFKGFFYFPILYLVKSDKEVKEFTHGLMINSISFKIVK
jgi:SAM-dependent methyltransferase